MKRLWISTAIFLLASVAHATDWQPISKPAVTGERAEYSLDYDSIRIRQGHLSGYVLVNYARPKFKIASVTDLYAVDCNARTIAHLSGTSFDQPDAQGNKVEDYLERDTRMQAVQSHTLGEQILNKLCNANAK